MCMDVVRTRRVAFAAMPRVDDMGIEVIQCPFVPQNHSLATKSMQSGAAYRRPLRNRSMCRRNCEQSLPGNPIQQKDGMQWSSGSQIYGVGASWFLEHRE